MFAGENLSAASGVWRKRPRSRPHLRRPPQLGSDSLARPTRLPSHAKVHARRAVPAAWVLRELLSDSHVRARSQSLGATLTPACARRGRSGAPVWLCVSQTKGPFYRMETSRKTHTRTRVVPQ